VTAADRDRPALGLAIGAAIYLALSTAVLSMGTAQIYGFKVDRDLGILVVGALQICPLFAGLVLVLVAPMRDRITERVARGLMRRTGWGPAASVAAAALIAIPTALVLTGLTAASITMLASDERTAIPAYLAPSTLFSLFVDLLLIAFFAQFLHALTRRWIATVAMFLGYVVAVIVFGTALGITQYIGFASTPSIGLTGYDRMPVNFEAAWAWRIYWLLVTATLAGVMYAFGDGANSIIASVRAATGGRPRKMVRLAVIVAPLLLAGGVAAMIRGRQSVASARYARVEHALSRKVPVGEASSRTTLDSFALGLRYVPERRRLQVEGTLRVVNDRHDGDMRFVLLEKSPLLQLDQVAGDRAFVVEDSSPRHLALALQRPLAPREAMVVTFAGVVSAENPFDRVARSLMFSRGFYLTSAHLLPIPRSADCLEMRPSGSRSAPAAGCGGAESYLMTDGAVGRVSVTLPTGLSVASVSAATLDVSGAESRFDFAIDRGRLTGFFLACTAFASRLVPATADAPAIQLFVPLADSGRLVDVGRSVRGTMNYYASAWPPYRYDLLTVVETPSTLNEATAYAGAVTVNERLLRLRAVGSREGSGLANLALAHELAHQWWGFSLVPAKAPGQLFVLESIAQFAAYSDLDRRGILPRDTAIARERARFVRTLRRPGLYDRPLAQIEKEDWLAYQKGAFVLLLLDKTSGGLMTPLGRLLAADSSPSPRIAHPGQVVEALIQSLPVVARSSARAMLTTTDSSALTVTDRGQSGAATPPSGRAMQGRP